MIWKGVKGPDPLSSGSYLLSTRIKRVFSFDSWRTLMYTGFVANQKEELTLVQTRLSAKYIRKLEKLRKEQRHLTRASLVRSLLIAKLDEQ